MVNYVPFLDGRGYIVGYHRHITRSENSKYQNVVCICCNVAEQAVLRPAHLPPQLQHPGKILVVPGLGLKDSGSSEVSPKNTEAASHASTPKIMQYFF